MVSHKFQFMIQKPYKSILFFNVNFSKPSIIFTHQMSTASHEDFINNDKLDNFDSILFCPLSFFSILFCLVFLLRSILVQSKLQIYYQIIFTLLFFLMNCWITKINDGACVESILLLIVQNLHLRFNSYSPSIVLCIYIYK